MKIIHSTLFRATGVYTITSIINASIPFFLLPVLTRYMTPEEYGLVAMFSVVTSFIIPFSGLSTNGAITRMYYEKENIDIRVYTTNCLLILVISTSIISSFFYFLAGPLSRITSLPVRILWVVVVISFSQFIIQVVLNHWQVQVKPMQYGIFQISKSFINASFSIWFVVFLGMSWQGRIWAQLSTFLIFAVLGIAILWKNGWLHFSYHPAYIRHALKFGIPLIPHTLGGVILTMTDRIFVTNMVGLATTGIYTVGYQIGAIIALLTTSFNSAYIPWLFTQLKTNLFSKKVLIVKLTYLYFLLLFSLALILSMVAPVLLSFFVGKEFAGSSIFVIWISLGYAFQGMYLMVACYITYVQKTSIFAWVTAVSALLNIGLNYMFINRYGAIGAAQATTIIYGFKFVIIWILSSKVYDMPWGLKNKN
jgi:O-antigen/teichoic acid export membrane protein